jgi:predicted nucleotidyltransferase component of viral defense system
MNYPGYRTTLQAAFGKMRDKIHVVVGIGDAVQPHNLHIQLFRYHGQPMFENEISLLVYPLETIFAEKLETVISKGAANSRMKDYHDHFLLARDNMLPDRQKLQESLVQRFQNRGNSTY